jgi:hypothetical protein
MASMLERVQVDKGPRLVPDTIDLVVRTMGRPNHPKQVDDADGCVYRGAAFLVKFPGYDRRAC